MSMEEYKSGTALSRAKENTLNVLFIVLGDAGECSQLPVLTINTDKFSKMARSIATCTLGAMFPNILVYLK